MYKRQTFVNAHDLKELEAAILPNTKAVYLETLGNPNSDIPDIDAIAEIAPVSYTHLDVYKRQRQNYTKDRRVKVQQTQNVQKNQQTIEKTRNLVTKKGQKKK